MNKNTVYHTMFVYYRKIVSSNLPVIVEDNVECSTFVGSNHIYVTLVFTVHLIFSDVIGVHIITVLFNLSKLTVSLSQLGEGGILDS